MSGTLMFVIFLALSLVLVCAGVVFVSQSWREERLRARLRAVQPGAEQPRGTSYQNILFQLATAAGKLVARSGLLTARTRSELEQTLAQSGIRRGRGLELFVGTKFLLLVLLPLIAFMLSLRFGLSPFMRDIALLAASLGGLLAPEFVLRKLRGRYLTSLDRGLPDALDLMVICTEAGLGLEPTIMRVATEIRPVHAAVAEEFSLTAAELRIASDVRTALLNAGVRTGLEGIKRLATTLVQTLQYGTPLSQALKTLAAEMRQEMLTRFEARAARLPVLLTVPMIIFILPCVFLVIGGPAIVQVLTMMKH